MKIRVPITTSTLHSKYLKLHSAELSGALEVKGGKASLSEINGSLPCKLPSKV